MKLQYIVSILFFISSSHAFLSPKPIDNVVGENVDALAESLLEISGVAGLSISIAREGHSVYSKAFGYADIDNHKKMRIDHTVRTASVAKLLTATAIGKLASDKQLNFDDPIKKYVPNLPVGLSKITIRQLAGHTSGVEHHVVPNARQKRQYNAINETLPFYNGSILQSAPNEKYLYSTAAFNLLAAAIEGASGMPFQDYLKEKIFKPLCMSSTYAEDIGALPNSASKSYQFKKGKLLVEKKLFNGSYKLAGAGFRSTAEDLNKLASAYNGIFIKEETVDEMFKNNTLNTGESTEVGITWRRNRDFKNRLVMDHAGSWQGARTVLAYYPKEKLSVAIMINTRSNIFIEETAHILAHLFLQNATEEPMDAQSFIVSGKVQTQKGYEKCKGELEIYSNRKGKLILQTSNEAFQSIPILPLNSKGEYCASTTFGLFYMALDMNLRQGDIYLYANRQSTSPLEKDPIVSIQGLH